MNSFEMTRKFHEAMELPVHDSPREPTVSERILRAKLLLEETLETIEKGLGLHVHVRAELLGTGCLEDAIELQHRGGAYDPVETLDGLADVKVIANGTALQFGLPMTAADCEVFESNMSKLDDNGRPIMNCCTVHAHPERFHEVSDTCNLLDPTKPVGKILKGPNFREPNIKGLLNQ